MVRAGAAGDCKRPRRQIGPWPEALHHSAPGAGPLSMEKPMSSALSNVPDGEWLHDGQIWQQRDGSVYFSQRYLNAKFSDLVQEQVWYSWVKRAACSDLDP